MTIEEIIADGGCKNCINCITLYKHPWNKKYKGRVSEEAGLKICLLEHDMDKNRKGIIMEHDTVGCECFIHINHKEHKIIDKYKL